jgi:hypothetical protein
MDMAEAGKRYDPAEEEDVVFEVGRTTLGAHARFSVGGASPGAKDLAYRTSLFARFLEALGLSSSLRMILDRNRMTVGIVDPAWEDASNAPWDEELGRRAIDRGLVMRNVVEHVSGANFRYLGLQLPQPLAGRLVPGSALVVDAMGGPERIVRSELSVFCEPQNYEAVRQLLNPKPFGPWRLMFTAVSRYRVSDLDQIMAETEHVLFRAFTVKPRGVGPVEAELYYADGTFMLTFMASCETERQTQALERFVADLGEGEDIVDHTPT